MDTTHRRVIVYSQGLCYASVCAPKEMTGEEVAAAAQDQRPSGTERGWRLSTDPTFRTGQANGCTCPDSPDTHRHWLLDC